MSLNATLFAQMVVFAILIWFTVKYVWPMLQGAMQERETRIADGLAAAERGKNDLALAEKRSAELVREGKDKAQELITQAQRRANGIVEQAKETAREEAEKIVELARTQVEQERNEAREALRRDVAALAVAGATRILQREVDASAHHDALEKLAAEL